MGQCLFDGESGHGEPEEGAQIKEWGGVSLWVTRKHPPVILLARQKHRRLPSNTTGDIHIFTNTHTLLFLSLQKTDQRVREEHTNTQNKASSQLFSGVSYPYPKLIRWHITNTHSSKACTTIWAVQTTDVSVIWLQTLTFPKENKKQ